MDTMTERQIARFIYDGKYDKAITCLLDIIKQQDKKISVLSDRVNKNTRGEVNVIK